MTETTLSFRPLNADEIDCRIARVVNRGNSKYVMLLLYKDARCDMNILDETVGPMNWERKHSRDNANCTVSIYNPDRNEWVSKEDTGTESNTEKEKGLASDSFKRACFNWGIGRELYTAPTICVYDCEITNDGKCYDRFAVSEIGYNDNRIINHLVIVNAKTGKEVYRMKDTEKKAPREEPEKPVNRNPMNKEQLINKVVALADANRIPVSKITEKDKVTKLEDLPEQRLQNWIDFLQKK